MKTESEEQDGRKCSECLFQQVKMKLFKVHKDIEIYKRLGNVRISTFKYSKPIENSDKWEHYTEISCWYDSDCENCPCGLESRSYEGECDDCGCLFDRKGGFDVPKCKCMLPKWIKRLFAKHKEKAKLKELRGGEYG